jgi:hypothetical protein
MAPTAPRRRSIRDPSVVAAEAPAGRQISTIRLEKSAGRPAMHRDQLGLLVAVALCMLVAPGGVQAAEDPAASPPAVRSPKSAPQKIAHRHERSSVMSLGAIGRLPAPRSDNPVAKFDASDQATKEVLRTVERLR